MRAGAVARQLGLEERAEEERVAVRELERARRAVLVVGAEDDAGLLELARRTRARSRRSSGSAPGAGRRRRSRRSACRACSGSRPRGRRGCTPAATMTSVPVSGAYSAWSASGMFASSRARWRIACWKPPHVPRNGMPCSRAVPTASITFSRSVYGLPGTTQMPSKPVEVVGLGRVDPVRVEHEPVAPAQRVDRAAGCARGRGRWASGHRPARAWLAVMGEHRRRASRVHVQR